MKSTLSDNFVESFHPREITREYLQRAYHVPNTVLNTLHRPFHLILTVGKMKKLGLVKICKLPQLVSRRAQTQIQESDCRGPTPNELYNSVAVIVRVGWGLTSQLKSPSQRNIAPTINSDNSIYGTNTRLQKTSPLLLKKSVPLSRDKIAVHL